MIWMPIGVAVCGRNSCCQIAAILCQQSFYFLKREADEFQRDDLLQPRVFDAFEQGDGSVVSIVVPTLTRCRPAEGRGRNTGTSGSLADVTGAGGVAGGRGELFIAAERQDGLAVAPNRPRRVPNNMLKNKQKTITPPSASRLRTSRQISYRKGILRSSFSVLRVDGFAIPPPTAWPLITSLEQAFSVLG